METIYIYDSVKLYKDAGTFSYTDTYGERHEFSTAEELWEHLTEDGEEWPEDVKSFIFG